MKTHAWAISFVLGLAAATGAMAVGCSSSDSSAGAAVGADLPGVGEHVSQAVTAAAGGTVKGTGVTIAIPAGALAADTTVTVDIKSRSGQPAAETIASNVFELGPSQTFTTPVSLTLDYDTSNAPSGATAKLAYLDGSTWKALDGSTAAGGKVTGTTTHFSSFAIVWVSGQGQTGGACDALAFTPCGGDLTGTWTFGATCATLPAGSDPFQGKCAGASMSIEAEQTGTVTFGGDKSFSVNSNLTATLTMSVPKSCLPSGATCDMIANGKPVTDDGTNCVSVQPQDPKASTDSGTWRSEGTQFWTTSTGETTEDGPFDYCVTGNTAKVKTVTKDGTTVIYDVTK